MNYYFIDKDKVRQGPIPVRDLSLYDISPTTLVWRKGMETWVAAKDVKELSFLFSGLMHETKMEERMPLRHESQSSSENENKKNRLLIGLIIFLILVVVALLVYILLSGKGRKVEESSRNPQVKSEIIQKESESEIFNMSGFIGTNMEIFMTLNIDAEGGVIGACYYKKMGPSALLFLKGNKENNRVRLNEYNKDYDLTGRFQGSLSNGCFYGNYEAFTHKNYQFELSTNNNMSAIDLSTIYYENCVSEIYYGETY